MREWGLLRLHSAVVPRGEDDFGLSAVGFVLSPRRQDFVRNAGRELLSGVADSTPARPQSDRLVDERDMAGAR